MAKFKSKKIKNRYEEVEFKKSFNFKEKIKKAWIILCGSLLLGVSFVIGGYANNIGVAYKKIELKGSMSFLESAIKEEMNAKEIYHKKLATRERQQKAVNIIKCDIATMNAKISIAKNKAINHKDIVDSMLCTNRPNFFK